MKSHTYIQSRLLLMLDQELAPSQQKQVQAHLEQCPECRALLAQMQELYQNREGETIPPLSPFVWTRVQARLQDRPVRQPSFRFGWLLVKPAIVMVLLVLSLWTGHYLGSIRPPTVSVASEEELVYRTFGMDAMEPFASHTLAGAVQAVYDQP
jgi:anti-sigma factor RsiW